MKKIGGITRGDINLAIATLQNKPAMRTSPAGLKKAGENITPATINRYLASLSSVFNFALTRDIIDVHPMKSGNVRKLTESKGRKRILTVEEEDRLLAAADECTWRMMRLYLRTLLTTAARKSEVLELRWRDVNLSESIATLHDTKNGETRILPLVDDVREALRAANKVRPLHSDFVFYDPRHPERHKNIEVLWKSVRQRAGLLDDRDDKLDRVVLHSTRHTAATKLVMGGANIAQVAAVTGHKTLSQLKRYTHSDSKDSVALAQRLLGGKGGK
jgi:integrase